MNPEEKKKFNFGTGEIDTEKWLLGIDSGLEGYYKTYGDYWGKERTAEVQAAMQNLIGRISSGDMMSRGADGTYNFASQLYTPERNKYTKWAYRTALGYLSNVGRGLVTSTETKKEELKKNTPKYSLQTLIQRLNNSIMRGATQLKLENTWWNKATQQLRVDHLKNFFANEAKYLRDSQDELGTAYSDLTKDLLASMMEGLSSTLSTTGDFTKQFNQLGIYNILNPIEVELPQQKKTVDELITDYLKAEENRIKEIQLGWLKNKQPDSYYSYDNDRYNKYKNLLDIYHNSNLNGMLTTGLIGKATDVMHRPLRVSRDEYNLHFKNYNLNVEVFLNHLSDNWESLFDTNSLGLQYKDNNGNNLTYTPLRLADNLAALMYSLNNKFAYIDERKSPINVGNDMYYIPGTYRKSGDVLLFDAYNKRLTRSSITKYPNLVETLGSILYEKEGGILKYLNGGGYDPSEFTSLYRDDEKPIIAQLDTNDNYNNLFTNAEYTRIGATLADIASMGAAFVPGYGTAASAVLGLGSTIANFGADLADNQGWKAAKNASLGLAADVMGLIPGLGGIGKGAKIARNLMWAVPKMMQWVNTVNGLSNAEEIKNSIIKLTSPSSMTVQDWQNVSQALQIMTGHGRSIATKVKKSGMSKSVSNITEPEYYIFTNNGKQKVSDETFKKLRDTRGTKARQALTLELMGDGVTLQLVRFAPWNTSTKFGAFKEVPSRTKMEVHNKHKGWFSDENLVESVENLNPSIDIRGILHKINPYRSYYSKRNLVSLPERNYSVLEGNLAAAASPLDIRGPKQPYPTSKPQVSTVEVSATTSKPKNNSKKRNKKNKKHEIGGILKALRNGGILKAQNGTKTKNASPAITNYDAWVNLLYSNPKVYLTLKGYKEADASDRNPNGLPSKGLYANDAGELDFMSAYQALLNYYNSNGGKNIFGDALNYYNKYWLPEHQNGTIEDFIKDYNANVDWLRSLNTRKFGETAIANLDKSWGEYNELFNKMYGSYSPYSEKLKDTLGESTWQRMPNAFANLNDREDLRSGYLVEGDENSRVAIDNEGHLIQNDAKNDSPSSTAQDPQSLETGIPSDKQENPELKSPFDYRPLLMGARFATTGLANSWLYDRIEDRLPDPAYKDFIDRKLDTIGDYAFRVHKANLGVDASSLQKLRLVSDQSLNLAADYETGRIRRGLEDEGYVKDAEKQATTHEAALQVDMKDLEDNRDVAFYNRAARREYLKELADIRNARDKANADNTMALVNNLTGWAASLFTENKAKYEQAKALMNPTPEERAQETMRADPLYLRLLNGDPDLTPEEKNLIRINNLAALRQGRIDYATEAAGGSTKTSRMKDDATNIESKKAIRKEAKDLKFLRQNRVISDLLVKSKGISEDALKAEGFIIDTSGTYPVWIKKLLMGGTLEYFKSLRK